MKNRIVKVLLSVMMVSLNSPIMHVFGAENVNLSAGITKEIEKLTDINGIEDPRYVAFTTANVNIRSEPQINAKIVAVISFNNQIYVFDYNDEWVAMLWSNGIEKNEYKKLAYINKEYISELECSFDDYNLYDSNGFKSFMPYTAITNTSSDQYKLQKSFAYTGNYGIRQVCGRYCVAIGTAFNTSIGTYFDLILENETVVQCIVSDIKSKNDTFHDNITTSKNGCVSEFVIDKDFLNNSVKLSGDISSCCEEWNSPVKIIRIYDKNIFD